MNKEEILDFLIIKELKSLASAGWNPEVKKYLFDNEYFVDEDCCNFTSKANDTLNEYYKEKKDKLISVLKEFETLSNFQELLKITDIKSNNEIEYLMRRLQSEKIIFISVSTDFDKRIKFIFDD